MPLTPFQKGVAHILAKHRNPESYVAGGAVINRGEGGVRISDDLDVFHDLAASVAASAGADAKALREAGTPSKRQESESVQPYPPDR